MSATPTDDARRMLAVADAQPPARRRLARLLMGPGATRDVPTSPHELALEVFRLMDELRLPREERDAYVRFFARQLASSETHDVPEASRQQAREALARWLLGDDSGSGDA